MRITCLEITPEHIETSNEIEDSYFKVSALNVLEDIEDLELLQERSDTRTQSIRLGDNPSFDRMQSESQTYLSTQRFMSPQELGQLSSIQPSDSMKTNRNREDEGSPTLGIDFPDNEHFSDDINDTPVFGPLHTETYENFTEIRLDFSATNTNESVLGALSDPESEIKC